MIRTTHIPMGRLARPAVAVLFLAALACGGHKKATVTEAEAHGVTPIAPEAPPVVETRTPAFENADAAYKAGDFKAAAELFRTKIDSAPDDACYGDESGRRTSPP